SVEHILPKSKGGRTVLDNLALSCQGCNNHKYNKTESTDPLTGKSTPLYHPRRDRWHQHFTWGEEYTLIIGLTPTGRATVETLQLNREGVVNLRRLLHSVGKHPTTTADFEQGN
ncbi:MAG TPA: HNH endonuclease, partial [Chloroflexia bacterium]|nr:HNH endonuclease [Chloroflexia bacterium]